MGADLARHDGSLSEATQGPLSLPELLELLGDAADGDARSREDAIAVYLSRSQGWREAARMLGGTFATGSAGATGVAELIKRKAD